MCVDLTMFSTRSNSASDLDCFKQNSRKLVSASNRNGVMTAIKQWSRFSYLLYLLADRTHSHTNLGSPLPLKITKGNHRSASEAHRIFRMQTALSNIATKT
ncbi:hypothetical protein Ahy_B06g086104 isoform F [Arachis hypogaea]|uniref:Uncharacterized protein n=1 Tax=Arachis hypogaea TaxID=3818 RepID=A0A444YWR1_ARAHY|nr:hypothetical protein Ahy_B06g086104 isoform F [Arachis hypogaea]